MILVDLSIPDGVPPGSLDLIVARWGQMVRYSTEQFGVRTGLAKGLTIPGMTSEQVLAALQYAAGRLAPTGGE